MRAPGGLHAFIALGSNLGDRMALLRQAVAAIERFARVLGRSSVYETAPEGGAAQPDYLNAALLIETDLAPPRLMEALLRIEAEMGRMRRAGARDQPRPIDLDVLLLGARGERVQEEPGLIVPHPRLHERAFVLAPLCEINAGLLHPVTGTPLTQLYQALLARQPAPRRIGPL